MKISWYGTASVILESNGYRIAFDPFLGIPLKDTECRRKLRAVNFRSVDAVLATHGHFDHILDIPRLYKDSDIKVYATKTPCQTLANRGFDNSRLRVITPGIGFTLGDFKIKVYQGRHCRFDLGVVLKTALKPVTFRNPKRLLELLKLNKKYAENEETLFYEIEAEGKRIQLMGSMGLNLSADYPACADVLILPFQGTGNPARTVAPIIARLQPKRILLDHYDDTFPPMSSHVKTINFIAAMQKAGIPAAAMKVGKAYTV